MATLRKPLGDGLIIR